jgi:hypothetical protein
MKLLAVFENTRAFRPMLLEGETFELYSSEPLHPEPVPNNLLTAAVWGGVIGGILGAGLSVGVFHIVNLRTGHMPIITLSPIGVIFFGIAALASIAGVLIAFLREAGLLTTRLKLPSRVLTEMSHGAVAVLVTGPTPDLEKSLQAAGAKTEWLS